MKRQKHPSPALDEVSAEEKAKYDAWKQGLKPHDEHEAWKRRVLAPLGQSSAHPQEQPPEMKLDAKEIGLFGKLFNLFHGLVYLGCIIAIPFTMGLSILFGVFYALCIAQYGSRQK